MAESALITTKRNFIVRALGFTAAGATLSVPIITVADAKARMQHHIDGLEAAMRDYYAGADILVQGNWQPPEFVHAGRTPGCFMFWADKPKEERVVAGHIREFSKLAYD